VAFPLDETDCERPDAGSQPRRFMGRTADLAFYSVVIVILTVHEAVMVSQRRISASEDVIGSEKFGRSCDATPTILID
jgi:hypothetical protein